MNKKAKLINIDDDLNIAVSEAAKYFFAGEVFIYPADTVYGFGCSPFNEDALEKINNIKQRQETKQFILLIDSLNTLSDYAIVPGKMYEELLRKIWPNPVSVILELNDDKKKTLRSETAAFRIPDHKFCLTLLKEIKSPLVSTSVNIKDEPPLYDHLVIIDKFSDDVSAIFYTNYVENREPSALIDLRGEKPEILRQGSTKFVDLLKMFR